VEKCFNLVAFSILFTKKEECPKYFKHELWNIFELLVPKAKGLRSI